MAPVWADAQDTIQFDLDGKPGIWFSRDKAKKLLEDVSQLPGIKLQLELTSKRLELEKVRGELLERNVKTVELIAVNWKNTAEAQSKLISVKDPWWKSPYLWLTVGIVTGAAATIGILHAAKTE